MGYCTEVCHINPSSSIHYFLTMFLHKTNNLLKSKTSVSPTGYKLFLTSFSNNGTSCLLATQFFFFLLLFFLNKFFDNL